MKEEKTEQDIFLSNFFFKTKLSHAVNKVKKLEVEDGGEDEDGVEVEDGVKEKRRDKQDLISTGSQPSLIWFDLF